jgi:hypothetical protein
MKKKKTKRERRRTARVERRTGNEQGKNKERSSERIESAKKDSSVVKVNEGGKKDQ